MFEKFKGKTKEEKKEVLKNAGKVTLGLAGVGALSFILGQLIGFKDGVSTVFDKAVEYGKQKEEHEESNEEEGEA